MLVTESQLPVEVCHYFEVVRQLEFDERPDYNKLRDIFKQLFYSLGYEYDYQYDWVLREKQMQISPSTDQTSVGAHSPCFGLKMWFIFNNESS